MTDLSDVPVTIADDKKPVTITMGVSDTPSTAKTAADMDGASALAALASAAVAESEEQKNQQQQQQQQPAPQPAVTIKKQEMVPVQKNGSAVTTTPTKRTPARGAVNTASPVAVSGGDANWYDVGIIKGTSCTVSSYYLPGAGSENIPVPA